VERGFSGRAEAILENVSQNNFTCWIEIVKCLNCPSLFFLFYLFLLFSFIFLSFLFLYPFLFPSPPLPFHTPPPMRLARFHRATNLRTTAATSLAPPSPSSCVGPHGRRLRPLSPAPRRCKDLRVVGRLLLAPTAATFAPPAASAMAACSSASSPPWPQASPSCRPPPPRPDRKHHRGRRRPPPPAPVACSSPSLCRRPPAAGVPPSSRPYRALTDPTQG
jgi:hypothetical protein